MQTEVAKIITTELTRKLGVPVKINQVNIRWFNRLVLEDLYLEDQEGKVLFKANHVAASLDIPSLFEKRITFNTVRVFGPNFHLSRQSLSDPLNLKFVLDAFASKDTTPKKFPNLDFRCKTLLVAKGDFRYDVNEASTTPGKFNARHIHVKNFNTKISLKTLRKDSIQVHVKKLSLDEVSGFSLNKMSLILAGNMDSVYVKNLDIKLPQTELHIPFAKVNLPPIDSIKSSFVDKAKMSLGIAPSLVYLKDLSPFVPAFKNFRDSIELLANVNGKVNDLDLENLALNYGNKIHFIGKMNLRGITNPEEAYVLGKVKRLNIASDGIQDLLKNFVKEGFVMPPLMKKLGNIGFTGEISGFFDNLIAYGNLSTDIGSIKTDLTIGKNKDKNIAAILKGRVETSEIALDELLGEKSMLGKAKCLIDINAVRPVGGYFSGGVNADISRLDFKNYTYRDIKLTGNFGPKSFDGSFIIDDENISFSAAGVLESNKENSIVNLDIDLEHFKPDKLNLTDKYESPDISFAINADFTGNSIDNAQGRIDLRDVSFKTKTDTFNLKELRVLADRVEDIQKLKITSDLINGEVNGKYSFATMVPSLMNTLSAYMPAVVKVNQKKKAIEENNFSLFIAIENTDTLSRTLKLPVTIQSQARIMGSYNNVLNKLRLEAYLPKFMIGKSGFDGGYLYCSNPGETVDLNLHATQYNLKGLRNYLDLRLDARDDVVNTFVKWNNNKSRQFSADLSATARFFEEEQDGGSKPILRSEIALHETPIVINDTLWHMRPSEIIFRQGKIDIDNFTVERDNQFVHLDGLVSRDSTDFLYMDLKNFELKYIFDILNIDAVKFAGKATGKFNISDVYVTRKLNTNLEVENFAYNNVPLGRLNLYSEWDDKQMGIRMLGKIHKNDSVASGVDGFIYPVRTRNRDQGLSLKFDANDIDIAFLHPFMKQIFQEFYGRGFGKVHLFGPFKKLNVVGDAYVADAGLGIGYLNTNYTFSDSIHLDTTSIKIRNVKIYDKYKNSGTVDLTFNHSHFKNFDYALDVYADDMLMYDVTEKQNPLIYGTVYGRGTATIRGNKQLSTFDINMQSRPKTHVYLNFMGSSTAEEYDFITFINKEKLKQEALLREEAVRDSIAEQLYRDSGTELKMNFLLDLTPDADIELVMDANAGDKIKGKGRGSMNVQYGTKQDVRIFGNYGIESGNYNFSLQQLIHKDFKIREGSTISFNGDPFNANMDINAIYNLTANLSDLDQNLALESARTNVPVNCVLLLNGLLRQPNISFDLELPGSNEELERQMKSLIDTDDMMMRQIVYLLVLNKFYTPEYTGTIRSNDFTAVASSALSSQISSLLNNITDKVQIGTNIRASQDGITDTEVEMLLSSQLLNNRLLFNGNFGYKNNPTQKNAFIGEFDLEYKLTRSGEFRLKAFNHANDMYQYLKQALTTQGVGIMFKKDFTRFSDLFRRRRSTLPIIFPKDTTKIMVVPKDSVLKTQKK